MFFIKRAQYDAPDGIEGNTNMNSVLTVERVRDLFDYDPDTGILTRRHFLNAKRKPVGCKSEHGYLRLILDNRSWAVHRVIWLWTYGYFPEGQIDHIDGNPANNRIVNLRDVSQSENQKNRRVPKNSPLGVMGVRRHGRMFGARILIEGKSKHLGSFDNLEEAIAVRKAFEQDYGYHENHGRK
jgi:hypothetical protein